MTTSWPVETKARQRILPTWPVPPGITIFIVGNLHRQWSVRANRNEQQTFGPRCVVPAGTKRVIRRNDCGTATRRRLSQTAKEEDAPVLPRVRGNSGAPKDT